MSSALERHGRDQLGPDQADPGKSAARLTVSHELQNQAAHHRRATTATPVIRRRSSTVLLLACAVLGLLLVPGVRRAAGVNAASARYSRQATGSDAGHEEIAPPANHPRRQLWAAVSALHAADASTALRWAQPVAAAGDPLGLEIMGLAYEEMGDFAAATDLWRRTGSTEALLRVATSAADQGAMTAAGEALRAAWELDPEQGTLPLASFLVSQIDDPVAAETIVRRTLADDCPCPSLHPYLLRALGYVLGEQGRWAEAAQVYDDHIAAYPDLSASPDGVPSPRVYDRAAWAYHNSGQSAKAAAAIEQALSIGPLDLDVLRHAGPIFEAAGERARAADVYRELLALRPNDKTAQAALDRLGSQ